MVLSSMLVVMIVQRCVLVVDAALVHPLVKPVVGRLEGGAKLLVALCFWPRGDGIDVGDGTLDLIQHQTSIAR